MSSQRPTKDQYFIRMAKLVSERGTCIRRLVGAVAVSARGHILSTGYNGVAAGLPHCRDETACDGARAPSGTNLDGCQAIHAEQNMLLQCRNVWEIDTVYCTASPCLTCVKLLMNTSCRRIVFAEEYPHADASGLWLQSGNERTWELLT